MTLKIATKTLIAGVAMLCVAGVGSSQAAQQRAKLTIVPMNQPVVKPAPKPASAPVAVVKPAAVGAPLAGAGLAKSQANVLGNNNKLISQDGGGLINRSNIVSHDAGGFRPK